jgi:hypothetical protein
VSIDRRTKLLHLSNARAAAGNQSLPQKVRDQYQRAADQLSLSAGLEDALQTKQENEAMSSMPLQPPESSQRITPSLPPNLPPDQQQEKPNPVV